MDCNQFLNDAKVALANANALNAKVAQLKKKKSKADAAFENEKKSVAATIDQRIKKRRDEIKNTYDSELDKANELLRKASAKKAKAKNQGIKERIADETYALRDTNRSLNSQIKTNFRRAKVPFYCEWGIFYRLFYPQSVLDFLIIILAFAICFAAIPFGLWHFLFSDKGIAALVVIYIADIVVFGGLVLAINRATVLKHQSVLTDAVQLRKIIANNEKKIDNIVNSIRNDSSEAHYDLGSYDDEIARIKQQLADITMKKNDALNTFENVTKNIITDEINNNAKAKLDELSAQCDEIGAELTEADTRRNEAAMDLSNNYEVYLGKEFMTEERINALQEIINHGTASNLSEAIEEYKDKLYDI